jgi:2,3-bisphosphoglycerate-dependent phosphoglycerate mutase
VRPFAGQAGIEIVVDEDLRERLIATTLVDDFPAVWSRSWDDFSFAFPGCETSSSAQARFVAAVNRLWSTSEEGNLIAISTHGNVIGLLLNAIDPTAGRQEAEQLTNPDVVKIIRHDGRFSWDRAFCLAGLAEIATDHRDTPVDM